MRNPSNPTDDSSDDDARNNEGATHQITQEKEETMDNNADDAPTEQQDDEIQDDDNINAANDSAADDEEDDEDNEEAHTVADEESGDEDDNTQATDEKETAASDPNATIHDDENGGDDEEANDDADNAKRRSTKSTTNKEPTEPSDEPGPTPPPTIAQIVQHLQDAKERTNWQEALTDSALILAIYESTATDRLSHTPNPTSTTQVFTNWAATQEEDTVAYIATGFAIMQQGTTAWMQDAFDAMVRDKHPPAQLHLTRMTATDRFTIMHGRNRIRTSRPSAQKDLWAAFTIDATGAEERILLAKPTLFKAGKVISPIEVVRGQMMTTGTKATTNQSEQANQIPTICPVPLTWAATILQHPDWTAQATAQYMTSQMLLWDLADAHVSDTAELVWRYLCGALTAGSKARPTVRFRFSANPTAFDLPATKFLDNLSIRLWRHELTPAARKEPPAIKQEPGRRTSGRLQQRQLATSASDTASKTATQGTAPATKSRQGTKPDSGTKGDRPIKSNRDATTPAKGTTPNSGTTPTKRAPTGKGTTSSLASATSTKQLPGTTKKKVGMAKTTATKIPTRGTATKRKGTPSGGKPNMSSTVTPSNKRSRRTPTGQQSGAGGRTATGTGTGTPTAKHDAPTHGHFDSSIDSPTPEPGYFGTNNWSTSPSADHTSEPASGATYNEPTFSGDHGREHRWGRRRLGDGSENQVE